MITQLTKKPEGYFENLPDNQLWFELYDNNGTYAYAAIDIINTSASFHTQILRWNHRIAKALKSDWEELKTLCRKFGVRELIASNADVEDTRWHKFIKLFNFPYPQTVLISKQEL